MVLRWFIGAILFFQSSTLYTQFSGYTSFGYGYHNNPLYNYQKIGDQLKQTYTELNFTKDYESSQLGLKYISGLMLFNRFEARNYYEHRFLGSYKIKFSTNAGEVENPEKLAESIPEQKEDNELEETEQDDESSMNEEDTDLSEIESSETFDDEIMIVEDSTSDFLDLGILASARHDKQVYKEFDNFGVDLLSSYRSIIFEDIYIRLYNSLGYRNYNNLMELSNITEQLLLQTGNNNNEKIHYGINLSIGYKFYTKTVYDTSRFEPTRTFVEKKPGVGKPGAKLKIFSDKKILTQPQATGTLQIATGLFLGKDWNNTGIETSVLYRYNPKSSIRYLAQYANTSILTDDIYNDHFSYRGIEAKLRFKQILPFNINMLFDIAYQQKRFEAPALNLIGEKISTNRKDIRSTAEIYLSKYIDIIDGLGIDLYLSGIILRNQSNDNYNDFSLCTTSAGFGIGL
ncbi:MAG: hypothetical protein Q8K98_11370 [Bacteroidota bacterium]|nr:hypothetical protein [Bacteroidota bacterium]